MHFGSLTIPLFLALLFQFPHPAQASWWNSGDGQVGLNLESGYDANTVTTLGGKITSLNIGGPHPQAQVVIDAGDGFVAVVLGPREYWAEHGIELKVGDLLTVRGSKAQGEDGVVYLLAQWLREGSQGREVSLRSDSGKPVWAGSGGRSGQAGSHSSQLRQHTPGRSGGRMGR